MEIIYIELIVYQVVKTKISIAYYFHWAKIVQIEKMQKLHSPFRIQTPTLSVQQLGRTCHNTHRREYTYR